MACSGICKTERCLVDGLATGLGSSLAGDEVIALKDSCPVLSEWQTSKKTRRSSDSSSLHAKA
eukprot:4263955-Karenia_brevis.AAC.1